MEKFKLTIDIIGEKKEGYLYKEIISEVLLRHSEDLLLTHPDNKVGSVTEFSYEIVKGINLSYKMDLNYTETDAIVEKASWKNIIIDWILIQINNSRVLRWIMN